MCSFIICIISYLLVVFNLYIFVFFSRSNVANFGYGMYRMVSVHSSNVNRPLFKGLFIVERGGGAYNKSKSRVRLHNYFHIVLKSQAMLLSW